MDKPQRARARRAETNASQKGWCTLVAALLPVLACALGGATEKWAEGIVLVLLALLMLLDPPRLSAGKFIGGICIALVACACIAFLPAQWFFQPEWRTTLTSDFGVQLPATMSPQPWATLQCLVSFIAGLSWLAFVCGRELDPRDVRRQMRWFAGAISLLALVCIVLSLAHIVVPIWHTERNFGPFPNRNQTADLFAITSVVVLACAAEDIRNRRARWLLWVVCYVVLAGAIMVNYSRAGIILLVLGAGLWLALFAVQKRSAAGVALGAAFVLLLMAAMLLFGGETLERLHLRGSGSGVSADFRWLIFKDALQLIRSSPWCGIGLGNFEPVFAIFRKASFGDTRAHHPESDWIWLWSEAGWIALLLAITGALLLLWRSYPRTSARNPRARLAGFLAATLFALHGLFDVSAHRVGTAMSAILLLGCAMPRGIPVRAVVAPIALRLISILLGIAGALWVFSDRTQHPFPGSLGADILQARAERENRDRTFAEAVADASRALAWTPLEWRLYFVRALAEANQRDVQPALADFQRARFLEPNAYEVPFTEGTVWLAIQPRLAVAAWREALRRAGSQRAEVYGRMLAQAEQQNPALVTTLHRLSDTYPELVITFLGRLTGDAFKSAIDSLLADDPDLARVPPVACAQLIELWSERGDIARLSAAIAQHPDWLPSASSGLEKYYAQSGDYRRAVELALRFGVRPALPQVAVNGEEGELQRRLASDPRNYAIGFALYQKQHSANRIDDALNTLRHFTEAGSVPPYFHYLEANCWAEKSEWQRAWLAYQKFTSTLRKD